MRWRRRPIPHCSLSSIDFKARLSNLQRGTHSPLIPASAPHLGIDHLDVGGIGLCGLNAHADGPCRLLPPISCYLCPSFAALRDGPHEQMLYSIETFLASGGQTNDKRILMQLEDVRAGILQVVSAVRTEQESA